MISASAKNIHTLNQRSVIAEAETGPGLLLGGEEFGHICGGLAGVQRVVGHWDQRSPGVKFDAGAGGLCILDDENQWILVDPSPQPRLGPL